MHINWFDAFQLSLPSHSFYVGVIQNWLQFATVGYKLHIFWVREYLQKNQYSILE